MKKRKKQYQMYFIEFFIAIGITSFSLSFLPFTEITAIVRRDFVSVTVGALFWLGVILMIANLIIGKRLFEKVGVKLISLGLMEEQRLPGAISFSKKIGHIILYAIFLLCLGVAVSDIIFKYVPEQVMFPVVSIILFTFFTHCVIDGKNFKIYKIIKDGMDNGNKQ